MSSPPEVTLHTSMGEITFELYASEAPKTCKNFIELAAKGYYDGVKVQIGRFLSASQIYRRLTTSLSLFRVIGSSIASFPTL